MGLTLTVSSAGKVKQRTQVIWPAAGAQMTSAVNWVGSLLVVFDDAVLNVFRTQGLCAACVQ